MKKAKKVYIFLFVFLVLSLGLITRVNAEDNQILELKSSAALLMDMDSGKILYEKNIKEKMYPASTTKIMTAILVIENCNLDDTVTVSKNAVNVSFGYVTANLKADEVLTVEQLLYVLLVGSSNDAAVVLAEHVSGSVDDFAILMNEKAKELGCLSTNFVNPNGVHDENHYSSAYDLALIARYAMQNELFRNFVSTYVYRLPATNKYASNDRLFSTTNDLINKNSNNYYKYAIGIKTGFTTPAKNCLVAAASKNNLNLLTVVLGANESSQRYTDSIAMFDYGFDTYTRKEIVKSGDVVHTVVIDNATIATKNLDAVVSEDIWVLLKDDESILSIQPEVVLNENLKAPIQKGDIIGSVKYISNGIEYKADLLANSDVEKSMLLIYIGISVASLFIILFVFRYIKRLKKSRK